MSANVTNHPAASTTSPADGDHVEATGSNNPGSNRGSLLNNAEIKGRISDLTAAYKDEKMVDTPNEAPDDATALTTNRDPRLAPAVQLARALLSHFYPASQGFSLRETNFANMQNNDSGWTIEIKPTRGMDAAFHHFPTECIAGFLVEKTLETEEDVIPDEDAVPDEGATPVEIREARTVVYTAMAVIADDMKTEATWHKTAVVSLGDLMSVDLGVLSGVQSTTCFMLIGTQLQLLTWNGGSKSEHRMMVPYQHYNNVLAKMGSTFNLAVDGKHWEYNLKLLDRIMTDAIKEQVVWTDGSVADGPAGWNAWGAGKPSPVALDDTHRALNLSTLISVYANPTSLTMSEEDRSHNSPLSPNQDTNANDGSQGLLRPSGHATGFEQLYNAVSSIAKHRDESMDRLRRGLEPEPDGPPDLGQDPAAAPPVQRQSLDPPALVSSQESHKRQSQAPDGRRWRVKKTQTQKRAEKNRAFYAQEAIDRGDKLPAIDSREKARLEALKSGLLRYPVPPVPAESSQQPDANDYSFQPSGGLLPVPPGADDFDFQQFDGPLSVSPGANNFDFEQFDGPLTVQPEARSQAPGANEFDFQPFGGLLPVPPGANNFNFQQFDGPLPVQPEAMSQEAGANDLNFQRFGGLLPVSQAANNFNFQQSGGPLPVQTPDRNQAPRDNDLNFQQFGSLLPDRPHLTPLNNASQLASNPNLPPFVFFDDTPGVTVRNQELKDMIEDLERAYRSHEMGTLSEPEIAKARLPHVRTAARILLQYFYPEIAGYFIRDTKFDNDNAITRVLESVLPSEVLGFLVYKDQQQAGKIPRLHTAMAISVDGLKTAKTVLPDEGVLYIANIMDFDFYGAKIRKANAFVLFSGEISICTIGNAGKYGTPWELHTHPNRDVAAYRGRFQAKVRGRAWEKSLNTFEQQMKDVVQEPVLYSDGESSIGHRL
ncbi:hypothetical protein BU16DRAFT_594366 [Lophium mytilinum]|uniref:Uncharacterized protein n=1 Tax=Lophium mytilinum TaxID=390894 RepID=A0A6A6QH95_9PEZI|nr:hypothetical protein BU16DRAFT_594366 [Lophium mytilinum]